MKNIVYFLDIDDCLIHTSQLTDKHLSVIGNQLSSLGIEKAEEITNEFAQQFRRLYDKHQEKPLTSHEEKLHKLYMQRLTELEKPVLEKWGEVKRWSREVCLYIAALKFGITLTNDEIISTSNALWAKITQYALFYPDSKPFVQNLLDNKIPFYLITSSDSRLTLNDDTQLFHYDPEYSRKLKLQRLKIFTDMGIPKDNIFIGDPYDKPKTWVFEQALIKTGKDIASPFTSTMIGDSVANDLIPARESGIDKLIWVNRNAELERQEKDGILILNSLHPLN